MQKEQIQEFTRRITQSNRSGLTLVTYEIFFVYAKEAEAALAEGNGGELKQAVRNAQNAVNELIATLDFTYPLAKQLHLIYLYCVEQLAAVMYLRSGEKLKEVELLMGKLYDAFKEVAKADTSEALMRNTEQVYAGYTYGRNDINENLGNDDGNRGYRV